MTSVIAGLADRPNARFARAPRVALAAAFALMVSLLVAKPVHAAEALSTMDLTQGLTASQVAQDLVGQGVTISNVTYSGANVALGTFSSTDASVIGFSSGVVMSTGCVTNVIGPNNQDAATCINGTLGDGDLTTLAGFPTFDAAVLHFDFTAAASHVQFKYVFGSEEYNEFANTPFNDTFAFFVNGTNCALVPNTNLPVSVNTINDGNPVGDPTPHNSQFYRNNQTGAFDTFVGGSIDTQLDGLTTVLTCDATVSPSPAVNHMKLAIADGSDAVLDSDVFIQASSLTVAQTSLTESASPGTGRAPLATTFQYQESNTGTDAISNVAVSGSICGSATFASGDTNNNGMLDPGEVWVFTCSHTFAAPGAFTDNATATGTDAVTNLPVEPETASTSVTVTNPHTTLTESASPLTGSVPLAVTFTYTETNDGTDPISNVIVTGSSCGVATLHSGDTNANGILDPGETWTLTCAQTFTAKGTFTDNATATGTDTIDNLVAPVETASSPAVTVTAPHTTLTEAVQYSHGGVPFVDTFTYAELNDGQDPISNVAVTGSLCGPAVHQSGDANGNGLLDPGETWIFTCTFTFQSTGTFTDSATATGIDTVNNLAAPPESASAQVTAVTANPPLTAGYWKNHQSATVALLPQSLGGYAVNDFIQATAVFNTMNCSNNTNQNAVGCLAGQLLAAELNVANNASNVCIASTLAQANSLLTSIGYIGPTGTYTLTSGQRSTAVSLATKLASFNNGTCS